MNDGEGITRTLADYSADLTYEDLPPEVVDRVKYFCLDAAGVTLNGSTTPSAQAVVRAIERAGRPGPSVVVGTSSRALPEYAAMANGTAFHSLELDDLNNESSLHPGVVVYPTALAMSDVAAVDGKTFIAAAAVGYEVMVRLGRALKPAEHYSRGFHPTGTCGAFGAAAMSARLLGLRGESFAHALGIAGSQTAGSMEFLAQGSWTKRFHPGWAAHSGIWAGLLASAGFIGPTTILEGRDGFLGSYSGDPDPSLVLSDLGEVFHITRTSVKPHSCCRYNQGAHRLCAGPRQRARDQGERRTGDKGWHSKRGLEHGGRPRGGEAQPPVGRRHAVQHALCRGRGPALRQGVVVGVRARGGYSPRSQGHDGPVTCVKDPALDAQFPRHWPAWAEVSTSDGRTLRSETVYPKGDPENPLSWEEMRQKFADLSAPVISTSRQERIMDAVDNLEEMRDVRELAELLAAE